MAQCIAFIAPYLLGLDFKIPMFCIMGEHDQQTSMELAAAYFATITAPRKLFVQLDDCHHFVVMNRPDDFLKELLACPRSVFSANCDEGE